MASNRQNEANRRNAKRSTGPKTSAGKANSSRNARRHGLSRPIADHEPLVRSLAGAIEAVDGCESFSATDVVLAKLELNRIRAVRYELLAALSQEHDASYLKRLKGLERYETVAFRTQKHAMLSDTPIVDGFKKQLNVNDLDVEQGGSFPKGPCAASVRSNDWDDQGPTIA
jgi:hypothetical protein